MSGRMMILGHVIILILLGVDWLEDPFVGQCPFSCAMASTPVNAQQETQHQAITCFDFYWPADHVEFFLSNEIVPIVQSATPGPEYSACFDSLHTLMSLLL
jgi:hypothetical protein